MLKQLYKKIIRKFNLSENQLKELREKLTEATICKGPFVKGEKQCPNTTALAIKEGMSKFVSSREVKTSMKKYGVKGIELWLFYALFDLPAIVSDAYFKKSLVEMQRAVAELIAIISTD